MHADEQELSPLWPICIGGKQGICLFEGIAQDAVVMNTDDLLCVGCTENILLSVPLVETKTKYQEK